MGDIIHALPAVASLKHSIPGSHVTWIVEPPWEPLLEGLPELAPGAYFWERAVPAGSAAWGE